MLLVAATACCQCPESMHTPCNPLPQAAIAARRVELVEEQRALSAIAAARDTTGVDALDQPGLAASLKVRS